MNSRNNKPLHIKPTRKKDADGGCGGCGQSVKRGDPRRSRTAQRNVRKKF